MEKEPGRFRRTFYSIPNQKSLRNSTEITPGTAAAAVVHAAVVHAAVNKVKKNIRTANIRCLILFEIMVPLTAHIPGDKQS